METQEQNQAPVQEFSRADEQAMLIEVLQNSRQAKNYMKWQLIITVVMVVVPLMAALFVVPFVFKQMVSVYSGVGL